MYRAVGLNDTHWGLIILYTAFNLSFSVWLMKGFMDEIPKEYEEAALLVDGYTRMQAFFKVVLPEAATGIAAAAVFCFITAWNEYAFALIMTNRRAQTAPPFISKPGRLRSAGLDCHCGWHAALPAAGGDLHLPAAQSSAARRHVRGDPQMIRADKLQQISEVVMVLGIIFLCQPWVEFLHRYGLTVIIVGLLTFMFTNWFGGEKGSRGAGRSRQASKP